MRAISVLPIIFLAKYCLVLFCYLLGIRVESLLPDIGQLSEIHIFVIAFVLIQSLCYDLCDGGAPHTSMLVEGLASLDAYYCRRTCGSRPTVVFPEVMIIWVGNLHAYGHSSLDEHG